VIPPFQSNGNLPPGLHTATWEEVADRFGSTLERQRLLLGLRAALDALRAAGCRRVYLDGSFVTAKRAPGDFDACWDVTEVDPALLDPVLLIFDQGRAAQKAKYGGELFPAQLPNGISGLTFLEFFQIDKRTGRPKGIIVLDLREWPP
jgi:hypothetical protein